MSALRDVLAAFDGARTVDEVAARCGLRRDVVDAAVTQLVRLGRLRADIVVSGCPSGGCAGCHGPGEVVGVCASRPGASPGLVVLSPAPR